MAKNHQYDTEGLTEIFRQYGDHLYGKGDHQAAIEQYIKTIGNLEPSYVICKVRTLGFLSVPESYQVFAEILLMKNLNNF